MTPQLHRMMYQMSHDQAPEAWDDVCYPHPEDLDEFTFELISRLMHMEVGRADDGMLEMLPCHFCFVAM